VTEVTFKTEHLTPGQKKAVEAALGVVLPAEVDEESFEWRYSALVRSAVDLGDGYTERIEKIESSEIGLTSLGDFVFKSPEKDTEGSGEDLVVPRSSVLWVRRTWKAKPPEAEDARSRGQYL